MICHCKHHSLGFASTALGSFTVAAQLADQCLLHLLLCDTSFETQVFVDAEANLGYILCVGVEFR